MLGGVDLDGLQHTCNSPPYILIFLFSYSVFPLYATNDQLFTIFGHSEGPPSSWKGLDFVRDDTERLIDFPCVCIQGLSRISRRSKTFKSTHVNAR